MTSLIANNTFPIYEWTFCGAAIVVTAGRFYIRWHRLKTAKWDDLFNGIALLSLIPFCAMNQLIWYDFTPSLFPSAMLAQDILLWTTLYSVKASFLALIHTIFNISADFRKAWWAVTGYTFLTFWPILLSVLWGCGSPSQVLDYGSCVNNKDINHPSYVDPLWFKFILHISSDVSILVLPLAQLRKLHMPTAKKIGVAAVFALIVIDIVCGIVRNVAVICTVYDPWNSGSDTYGTCADFAVTMGVTEPAIAVIVCALPVYRALLPSHQQARAQAAKPHFCPANVREPEPARFKRILSLGGITDSSSEPEAGSGQLGTMVPSATLSWPFHGRGDRD